MSESLLEQLTAVGGSLSRGMVRTVREDGLVEVDAPAPGIGPQLCQVLRRGGGDAGLVAGSEVLVFLQPSEAADGIVLGCIDGPPAVEGAAQTAPDSAAAQTAAKGTAQTAADSAAHPAPECQTIQARQIVIEAGERLELRCGKGTIVIRQDGKVVVRGEHILSAAKGTHRIKGGSVGIN